jgi:hypothetical protein
VLVLNVEVLYKLDNEFVFVKRCLTFNEIVNIGFLRRGMMSPLLTLQGLSHHHKRAACYFDGIATHP